MTKEKIKQRGLSVTWIAKQIGIPRTTLDNYLRNICVMPDEVEERLKMILK